MRWILLFVLLTIGLGIFLKNGGGIPYTWLNWIGHLPGDLIIKKGGVEILLPMASSFLISLTLSFLWSLLGSRSGA